MSVPTRLSQPRLVQLLAGWTEGDTEPTRLDTAERLAQWLGVPDAIALHAAHAAVRATVPRGAARARPPQGLEDEFRRVRATLEASIAHAGSQGERVKTRAGRGPVEPAPPEAPGFGPWQQRYQDQQRRMDMSVDALRAHVRSALATASPRLAQLAALDALLDPLLGERTQRLLATVPAHLERRFEQLRAPPTTDNPDDAAPDDSRWRPLFEQAFQAALLAELDVRLQPVMGLLEALRD